MAKYVEPQMALDSFSCPHCGALAHQYWYKGFLRGFNKGDGPAVYQYDVGTYAMLQSAHAKGEEAERRRQTRIELIERLQKDPVTYLPLENREYLSTELINVAWSQCHSCKRFGIWVQERLIYPVVNSEIAAHEEMPAPVKEDFEEAASIVDRSPRGAAALLRLAIQKLMPFLSEKGENINDDIASLVKKGLEVEIQQALDVVRVVGNNAVHPGMIDLKDDKATAIKLFQLLNIVVERRISIPKQIGALFDDLPAGAKTAIQKRDGTSSLSDLEGKGKPTKNP